MPLPQNISNVHSFNLIEWVKFRPRKHRTSNKWNPGETSRPKGCVPSNFMRISVRNFDLETGRGIKSVQLEIVGSSARYLIFCTRAARPTQSWWRGFIWSSSEELHCDRNDSAGIVNDDSLGNHRACWITMMRSWSNSECLVWLREE